MTEVTGFSLFASCHHFGRRARALTRSLASQGACRVPLELTVFVHRRQDAQRVEEGVVRDAGLKLNIVAVSEAEVMAPAILFAQARHDLSHTVFLAADLWFPPGFWDAYASAVASEGPSYWSCRVMNVPFGEAERLLEHWDRIDRRQLDPTATDRRHDRYAGRSGHFQCVPKDLLPYPLGEGMSRRESATSFAEAAVALSLERRWERRVSPVGAYHFDHLSCSRGTGGEEY